MDEKETWPDVTSGTPDMVVVEPQVMADCMAVTTSCTSAGRAVDPAMKQGVWRVERVGAEGFVI